MKMNYKTNFTGYLPILRGVQLLLKNKTLNFTQLGAYICFVAQADFDKRHKNFRVILRDDSELAKEWGCDTTTVYRNRKQLIKKGLLIEKDGLTLVSNFYIFDLEWVRIFAKLPSATLQSLFAKPQDEIANEQFFVAEMQKKQGQNTTQSSNVSFKGELGLSTSDDDIKRYFEENEIKEDINGGEKNENETTE